MRPCPKPKRIFDEDFSQKVRARDGVCVAGMFLRDGCSAGLDCHHITHRGAGGGDILENGISLCRRHHNRVHNGWISKMTMRSWLTRLYGYQYEEAEDDEY